MSENGKIRQFAW